MKFVNIDTVSTSNSGGNLQSNTDPKPSTHTPHIENCNAEIENAKLYVELEDTKQNYEDLKQSHILEKVINEEKDKERQKLKEILD
eukprot:Awhi_evm1s14310